MKELLWITNHPKSVKGMWPRRDGVEYVEGEPKATHKYSVDELKEQNLVGVYVNMDAESYFKLPLIMKPTKK